MNGSTTGSEAEPHPHGHSHAHSHDGPTKPGDGPPPSATALLWTRAGLITMLGVVLYVTVSYCTGVYFDRESAFRAALRCSEGVMDEAGARHWLQNGTLLGATRLGRLILWDADLDYGILDDGAADLVSVSALLDSRCFGYRSSDKAGTVNGEYHVWRKCTNRLCAEFHEAKLIRRPAPGGGTVEVVITGHGASPSSELLPLKECHVAEVKTVCPRNPPYFLAQAYGSEWLTKPLTKLF